MDRVFDVIIVGAGPAGSSCAERTAELGLSTLVLEKATFPRSKPCASGISARGLAALGFEIDPIVHDRVDTIRVDLGAGTVVRWRGAERVLATTTRRELDTLLARRAEAAGARVEFARRVRSVIVEGDVVRVESGAGRLSSRFVVGADGPWSAVRRSAGLRPPRHGGGIYVRCFPGDPASLDSHRGAITFDLSAARRGYGWIFPKRDHLNVGVYSQRPLTSGLRRQLDALVVRSGVDSWRREGPYAFPIPVGARVDDLASRRILLAGDAAGLADPITGEGISHAVASGRAAADAVAEATESGRSPEAIYRRRLISEVMPDVNAVRRAGNLCYTLGPRALAFVVRVPALRSALMRLGPWGRLGPEGGRLLVDAS